MKKEYKIQELEEIEKGIQKVRENLKKKNN
ncbi:hypothetical protein HNP70_001085 [Borreliella kurtenbachii]